MQHVKSAVIAAAGLGSRIGLGMPKCMIEIDGITILTRLINALRPHVPMIYLVVGYREEMVAEYCSKYHRDIILVRNPDYRTTNTAHSFSKGAHFLRGKVLYLDGDLIISKDSLAAFINASISEEILVGVTRAKSENAVFIDGQIDKSSVSIFGFSRTKKSQLEWANIVIGPANLMGRGSGYVYECLERYLPLKGAMIDLAEVDTGNDLREATLFARSIDRLK